MKSFGLDLGAYSIKAVQLKPEREKYRLLSFGMAPLPASFQSDSERDERTIAEAIKKLVWESKMTAKSAVLALAESQVFSRVIKLPNLSEAELKSAIKWEAEQYVPIPLDEANLDYQVIDQEKMEVFLVAAPKTLVQKYIRVVHLAGFQPAALETELIAVCRALSNKTPKDQVSLIINIGSLSSDLAITKEDKVVYTRSIPTGGNALARAVSRDLNLELSQAEEYKKSYGLDEEQLEGKVRSAIKPIFDTVVEEIRKAIIFYQKEEEVAIKTAFLCGGTAKLPGVVSYLAHALGLEIQIGDPLAKINLEEKQKTEIGDDAPLYTTAIGLAMKRV